MNNEPYFVYICFELIGTRKERPQLSTGDIMTGHKSVTALEKYIRADKLEVAQKLVLQYDYFK